MYPDISRRGKLFFALSRLCIFKDDLWVDNFWGIEGFFVEFERVSRVLDEFSLSQNKLYFLFQINLELKVENLFRQ